MRLYSAETASISASVKAAASRATPFRSRSARHIEFVHHPNTDDANRRDPFTLRSRDLRRLRQRADELHRLALHRLHRAATSSPDGSHRSIAAGGACATGQSAVTFANGAGVGPASITLYARDQPRRDHRHRRPVRQDGSTGNFAVNGLTTMSTFVLTLRHDAHRRPAVNVTSPPATPAATLVTTYTGATISPSRARASIGDVRPDGVQNGAPTTPVTFGDAPHQFRERRRRPSPTVERRDDPLQGRDRPHRRQRRHAQQRQRPGCHREPGGMNRLSLSAAKVVVRPSAADQLTIRAVDTYGNTRRRLQRLAQHHLQRCEPGRGP